MTGQVTIISRTHRKINGNYYARVRYKIDDGRPLDILTAFGRDAHDA